MSKLDKLLSNIEAIEIALSGSKNTEKLKQYSGFGELKCILLDTNKPEQFAVSEKNLIPHIDQLYTVLKNYSPSTYEYDCYVDSLKKSVLTAFYTPKELIHALNNSFITNNLKFEKMLDPSAGIGAFLQIKAIEYTAIEKDLLTGKILKELNPEKNINIYGFENSPQNFNKSYNLVASNIPFGDFKVFDSAVRHSKNPERARSCNAIHTYFFEKGLDTLKEGGILTFITSTGVMDSQKNDNFRKHLMSRANLIAAIRLPQNTFDGTKVQSDLIILQKNSAKKKLSYVESKFISTIKTSESININALYENNERTIHTKANVGTNLYGNPAYIYEHDGGIKGIASDVEKIISSDIRKNLDRKLFNANNITLKDKPLQLSLFDSFNNYINNSITKEPIQKPKEPIQKQYFDYDNQYYNKVGSYQTKDNYIGIAEDQHKAKILHTDDNIDLIKDYIKLRDSYFNLKEYENNNHREYRELRSELNIAYDHFVDNYGPITDRIDVLKEDVSYPEIKSLETIDNGNIIKADIFNVPVSFSNLKDIYTAEEALSISLNKFNKVDLAYISLLSKLTENEIINKLEGKIYLNPENYRYEQADLYLSGNVIEKLDKCLSECNISINRHLINSLEALKNVIPTKIEFEDIGISLGERWIPEKYYSAFASEKFSSRIEVKYSPIIDEYSIEGNSTYHASQKYAVQSSNRYYSEKDVLRFAMLDSTPDMNKKINNNDQKITIPDTEGIQKMNAAVTMIQNEFKKWLSNLPLENKSELETIYNRKFNCYIKPQFDGTYQTFPDLDKKALGINDLYDTQKNAILLLKNQNGGIIDHEVGGGKTLIQCIAAYEMKRLGLANKPCILGLKANIGQIAETFRTAYPNAKILYTTKEDLSKNNRADFFNKIQNNNWDCIIMTHEQFKAIPQSLKIQKEIIRGEINKIDESVKQIKSEDKNFKQIETGLLKRKENLEVILNELISKINEKKDNIVDFKTMGIDHLFVDESHKFKNLMFQTRHQRVAGLGNSVGSSRALNLLFAIRTIQERTGKDLGATFLSGTTISNSLTELYSIFNYLRPKALENQNILSFDAWAGTYALKSKDFEFNVTNDIVQKERFRQFIKVPELAMFYSQITDYKTAKDIGVDRPLKNEIFVAIDQTEQQKDMFSRLKDFAKTGDGTIIYREPLSQKEEKAKMLIATNTAKKAALDMRLIDRNMFSDESNNKVSIVADRIYDYYQKYDAHKGTQFVFSDIGTYKAGDNFNIYTALKEKLIEKGIPSNEIQFIQTATTDKKRDELFDKMNDGRCRVLLGSTEMLGTGVNAQNRCVAIHHFDIPWTPKDLEQREGRGVRKGNEVAKLYANNKVDVLVYATKETLDTYKFNLLKNKALFISQIKNNNISVRSIDEGGMDKNSGMNFAEYIAVLSGNTDLLQKSKLEKIVTQLKSEENIFLKKVRDKDHKIHSFNEEIIKDKKVVSLFKDDLKSYQSIKKGITEIQINGNKMTDPKKIGEAINHILEIENKDTKDYKKVGSIGSFNIVIKAERYISFEGREEYSNKMYVEGNLKYSYNNGDVAKTPKLAAEYPINALNRIESLIERYENKIQENEKKLEVLKKLELTFQNEDKLNSVLQELKTISEKLDKTIGIGTKDEKIGIKDENKKSVYKR